MSVFTEQSILLSNDLLKTEGVWNAKQAQDPRKLLLSIYLFAHNFFCVASLGPAQESKQTADVELMTLGLTEPSK